MYYFAWRYSCSGLTACGSSGNEDSETDTAQENTEGSAEETSGYDPVLYEDLTSTLVSLGLIRDWKRSAQSRR